MYCPNCGCENENDATICEVCGTALQGEPGEDREPPAQNERKSKYIILMICISVAILAVVAGTIMVVQKSKSDDDGFYSLSPTETVSYSHFVTDTTTETETASAETSTTQKETTTAKPSTTKKKETTTKRSTTTTQKQTTTAAPTTETTEVLTEPETTTQTHCTNNDNHSDRCGNIGRWFSTEEECQAAFHAAALQHYKETGDPGGMVLWYCAYCGKCTCDLSWLQ